MKTLKSTICLILLIGITSCSVEKQVFTKRYELEKNQDVVKINSSKEAIEEVEITVTQEQHSQELLTDNSPIKVQDDSVTQKQLQQYNVSDLASNNNELPFFYGSIFRAFDKSALKDQVKLQPESIFTKSSTADNPTPVKKERSDYISKANAGGSVLAFCMALTAIFFFVIGASDSSGFVGDLAFVPAAVFGIAAMILGLINFFRNKSNRNVYRIFALIAVGLVTLMIFSLVGYFLFINIYH